MPCTAAEEATWYCSLAVLACQTLFLAVAYAHAAAVGELHWHHSHISAVLDDETRSFACAVVSIASGGVLLLLEDARESRTDGRARQHGHPREIRR